MQCSVTDSTTRLCNSFRSSRHGLGSSGMVAKMLGSQICRDIPVLRFLGSIVRQPLALHRRRDPGDYQIPRFPRRTKQGTPGGVRAPVASQWSSYPRRNHTQTGGCHRREVISTLGKDGCTCPGRHHLSVWTHLPVFRKMGSIISGVATDIRSSQTPLNCGYSEHRAGGNDPCYPSNGPLPPHATVSCG